MPDIDARTRLLVGTTADWAASDLVIGDGEVVLERTGGLVKMKAGDGVAHYSGLPFLAIEPTIPPEYLTQDEGDARYLMLADVSSTAVASKVPRLGPGGLLPAAMIPLPLAIDVSTGAADAGKLVKTAASGKINATFLPPMIDFSAGAADAAKLVMTALNGKVDSSLITVTTGTYKGTVDATAAKPAGTYLLGDFFLNTGTGLAHASWGFAGGTTVSPGQQVIYNGTTWDTVQGAAYLSLSGGTLSGPLKIRDGAASGVTPNTNFDGLVVESNAGTGITIATPANQVAALAFATPANSIAGFVQYAGASDTLSLGAAGVTRVAVNAAMLSSSVPVLAPNGSAAAPAHAWNSDTGTGLFLAGAGIIGLASLNIEVARMTPTGLFLNPLPSLVGISNAASTLQLVAGTAGAGMARINLCGASHATTPKSTLIFGDPIIFYGTANTEKGRFTTAADAELCVGTSVPLGNNTGRGNITINGATDSVLALSAGGAMKAYALASASALIIDSESSYFNLCIAGVTKLSINATSLTDVINGQEIGWRNLPLVGQNAVYNCIASDRGKCIVQFGAFPTGFTAGAFSAGDQVSILNRSGGPISIPAGGNTLYWSGLSGTRTLAADGMATALFLAANTAVLSGNGIS